MKINLDEAQLNEFFTEFDPNGDGSLDYEDFYPNAHPHTWRPWRRKTHQYPKKEK